MRELRKERKLTIIAQALVACTTTWNVLKKKDTAGFEQQVNQGKQQQLMIRNIVRAVNKNPKTSVSDITNNLHRAEVKVSQSTICRRL